MTIIIYYYFCNHRWSVQKCRAIFIISFGYLNYILFNSIFLFFRSCSCQICTISHILSWSGDSLVSSARRTPGFHQLYNLVRYVGNWLYPGGNVKWSSLLPRSSRRVWSSELFWYSAGFWLRFSPSGRGLVGKPYIVGKFGRWQGFILIMK